MSEYQYYEFLAIDRPLSQEEQEAVARRSSRVEPHPRRAVFTYNWSDFPGRAEDVLARYYDAMLYLAWLKTLTFEDVLPTLLEPPVPPGLNELSPALETFVELFELDELLLQVAAETSAVREPLPEAWIERGLARLSRQECERYLLRLVQGEPHLSVALLSRLREMMGRPSGASGVETPQRTVGTLLAEADRRRKEQRRRRAEAAERKRLQELDALAQREAETWQEVDDLIEQRTGNAYDEAVQRLVRLRELAIHRDQEAAYARRIDQIREQYSRRSGLLRRMREAGLYPS
jgi:hypothetical protein